MIDLEGKCSLDLWGNLPDQQKAYVMGGSGICDIEPSFMGFVRIYKNLSEIIPKHFTVVDLGCAYAPQCWYFRNHAKYIGVDMSDGGRFSMPNTTHYEMTIEKFISDESSGLSGPTFAICSYVPPWHGDNMKLTQEAFSHAFTYYPASTPGFHPEQKR